jgi:hypothetical protein
MVDAFFKVVLKRALDLPNLSGSSAVRPGPRPPGRRNRHPRKHPLVVLIAGAEAFSSGFSWRQRMKASTSLSRISSVRQKSSYAAPGACACAPPR